MVMRVFVAGGPGSWSGGAVGRAEPRPQGPQGPTGPTGPTDWCRTCCRLPRIGSVMGDDGPGRAQVTDRGAGPMEVRGNSPADPDLFTALKHLD